MKVLHLSTEDNIGGAAKAAYRLHTGLRRKGIDSWMFVKRKKTDDQYVIGNTGKFWEILSFMERQIDKLPTRLYAKDKKERFSNAFFARPGLIGHIKKFNPDIIHIHWINDAFVSLSQLKKIFMLEIPVVVTLHDSWFFTGGSHVPYSCEKYRDKCGDCPVLKSSKEHDLSRKNLLRKKEIYQDSNFVVVAPSEWMRSCAQASYLLNDKNIMYISNAVNTEVFKPLDKRLLRKKWGFDEDKKYILFGAANSLEDRNKGFYLLRESLKNIKNKDCELIVFGSDKNKNINVTIPSINLGYIRDISDLVEIYSLSDVFVGPSLQESFGQTFLEAMSCGIPCVAFNYSGPIDIIDHKENGYLAIPYKVDDLLNGIEFCLNNKDLGLKARKKVEGSFTLSDVTDKYLELYNSLQ